MKTVVVQTPVRIGIAGLGRMGMHHLERLSLRTDIETVAVQDVVASRGDVVGGFGCRFFESWEQFLATPDVELVLIATPPDTHASLAIEALDAGKHVVVEKPLCLTTSEADAMGHAAHRAGRMLSVVQNRRWDDDFTAALETVRSGALGQLLSAKLIVWAYGFPTNGRPHAKTGWRQNSHAGGALVEFGTHYFDQLLLLAKATPQTVFAQIPQHSSSEACEDSFSAFVSFSDVMTAQIEVNLGSLAPLRTGWMLTGTDGGYANFRRYSITDEGEVFEQPVQPTETSWDRYYDTLVLHLRQQEPLEVTLEQARLVVRLIEASRESARQRQAVSIDTD